MSETLQANGNPVRLDGIMLRTPGLAGTATSHPTASPATRAATLTSDALEAALASHNFQTTATLELTGTREVPTGAVQTRSTSFGEPAIELQVPDPGEQWGQVILY
ncbi:MAG TPA: hypothetical protein VFY10_07805, partial [Dehalococcoidia bacterium]|nr:hypothetical protein [Dehalococcoidia bacterium]